MNRLYLSLILILGLLLGGVFKPVSGAEYLTDNLDFLSASELNRFFNMTLAGNAWGATDGLSASVTGGVLTVQSTGTVDGFLVYSDPVDGKAAIKLSGEGYIGIFTAVSINSSSAPIGYILDVNPTNVVLYAVNGTKTLVTSLNIAANDIIIDYQNGFITITVESVDLYQTYMGIPHIALGVEAGGTTGYDLLSVYSVTYLQGVAAKSLGRATLTSTNRVAEFTLDSDLPAGSKIFVRVVASDDPYLRYFIVSSSLPSQTFWKNSADKQNAMKFGTLYAGQEISIDLPESLSSGQKIYVGISVGSTYKWTVELLVESKQNNQNNDQQNNQGNNQGTQTQGQPDNNEESGLSDIFRDKYVKYALIGLGVIVVVVAVVAIFTRGGK